MPKFGSFLSLSFRKGDPLDFQCRRLQHAEADAIPVQVVVGSRRERGDERAGVSRCGKLEGIVRLQQFGLGFRSAEQILERISGASLTARRPQARSQPFRRAASQPASSRAQAAGWPPPCLPRAWQKFLAPRQALTR
jgi:hypothetical protein